MEGYYLSVDEIEGFKEFLVAEEKSKNTVEKYIRDVNAFASFCNAEITKKEVIAYKQMLIDKGYAPRSINSMLASINSMFSYINRNDLKIKSIAIQKQIFRSADKELTKEEYMRLCKTAEKMNNMRLYLILQTICSTGIRVSELQYITTEAVKMGKATVSLKGKTRTIFIIKDLQKKLLQYISKQEIKTGPVFVTRSGKPIGRTNIWREMKKLCFAAGVNPEKVFPHNLRHLFAYVFYSMEKDIAKLADILGHSSIDTTRIYIVSTGIDHLRRMEMMKLII